MNNNNLVLSLIFIIIFNMFAIIGGYISNTNESIIVAFMFWGNIYLASIPLILILQLSKQIKELEEAKE